MVVQDKPECGHVIDGGTARCYGDPGHDYGHTYALGDHSKASEPGGHK